MQRVEGNNTGAQEAKSTPPLHFPSIPTESAKKSTPTKLQTLILDFVIIMVNHTHIYQLCDWIILFAKMFLVLLMALDVDVDGASKMIFARLG